MEASHRCKYTDDRIDDFVREVRGDFEALTRRLDRRDAERRHERELVEQHRREDRKFLLQAALASVAMLITATGIIVSAFG